MEAFETPTSTRSEPFPVIPSQGRTLGLEGVGMQSGKRLPRKVKLAWSGMAGRRNAGLVLPIPRAWEREARTTALSLTFLPVSSQDHPGGITSQVRPRSLRRAKKKSFYRGRGLVRLGGTAMVCGMQHVSSAERAAPHRAPALFSPFPTAPLATAR
jgi:hypothetical protein